MRGRVVPARSPALSVPAPFFLAAPCALAVAGVLLLGSRAETFEAINVPQTVALTHAVVLGWLTTFMMGAVYQLGPAVLGGRLLSERIARLQFATHVIAVVFFIWTAQRWNIELMAVAGGVLAASFLLFFVNALPAVWSGARSSLAGIYLRASIALLGLTVVVGLTLVLALRDLWFPVTQGRLSAHAHLGLVGWLGLTVMGVSYQLVPMFNVVPHAHLRGAVPALALTTLGLGMFSAIIATDPPMPLRLAAGLALAPGPAIWAATVLAMMRSRSRRTLDIQGYATLIALGFLAIAIGLGLGATLGTPFTDDASPARWPLAYAAAGVGGWMGTALIGNSYKIVPFIVWFHRYRGLVGSQRVPLLTELYSEGAARAVLGAHVVAVSCVVVAAISGELLLLRFGGLLLSITALAHLWTLASVLMPKRAGQTSEARIAHGEAP
jgi:hypothetical protein